MTLFLYIYYFLRNQLKLKTKKWTTMRYHNAINTNYRNIHTKEKEKKKKRKKEREKPN